MVYDPTLDRNSRAFIALPGRTQFLRVSDSTPFAGVLQKNVGIDQRPGVLRQTANWLLTTQASVVLAQGETVTAGTRRWSVEYAEDDELGLIDYTLTLEA